MYRRAVLLTWGFSFILAELIGGGLAYLAYTRGAYEALSVAVADVAIVSLRLLFLIYIAGATLVSLANAVYNPLPAKRGLPVLLIAVMFVAVLDYQVAVITGGSYEPQLLDYGYYLERGALWGFPLKVAYYFSEIVAMNYVYVLAKMAWRPLKPPITAGTLFLVLGWALPHVFTKDVLVALYAAALVVVFYVSYEYTETPVTPVVLWFTVLIV